MNKNFKSEVNTLEKRTELSKRIRERFPDRYPIVVNSGTKGFIISKLYPPLA